MRQILIENGKATEVFGESRVTGANYVIRDVAWEDTETATELLREGYAFHDRVLCFTIPISATEQLRAEKNKIVPGIDFFTTEVLTDEMREIAYAAYKTDRRFHLEPSFDPQGARKIIDAYIETVSTKKHIIVGTTYKGKVTGFTFLVLENAKEFENVLGATANNMIGKMSAYALYAEMLRYAKELGYEKYLGKVSSSNAASQNLHINLGGNVSTVFDEYIWRK